MQVEFYSNDPLVFHAPLKATPSLIRHVLLLVEHYSNDPLVFHAPLKVPSLIRHLLLQVEIYNNDPLVFHAPLKARWAAEMIKAIELGREKIGEIIQPVLLFHGTNDHLVPFSSSEFVMKNIGSEDKTFEVQVYKEYLVV